VLPGPGKRTVPGPSRRGRSHTTPAKVLLRQTHGYSSGSALLTPPRYSAPSPVQDRKVRCSPAGIGTSVCRIRPGTRRGRNGWLPGTRRCDPVSWPAIRHATPTPERMFCERGPTDAYCFSRHSYSALWVVCPSVYVSFVTVRHFRPGRRGSWAGG
jgi:hypothetical protein